MSVNEDPASWRLKTPGGIPFKLVKQNGEFGEEDSQASMEVIIEARRLSDFINEGFPSPCVIGSTIYYPQRNYFPGAPSLTVRKIAWENLTEGKPCDPFDADSEAPEGTYGQFLKCTVSFGTSPWNDSEPDSSDPLTYLEVSSVASGEFLVSAIRGRQDATIKLIPEWIFPAPISARLENKDVDIGQPINQSMVEHNLRWSQIPYSYFNGVLATILRESMGKVNSDPMSIFNDAPAETIMFLGYSRTNQYTWRSGHSGTSPIALDLKFLEKNFEVDDPIATETSIQVTHNHVYRPGDSWRRLTIRKEGTAVYNPLYVSYDLNTIFELG